VKEAVNPVLPPKINWCSKTLNKKHFKHSTPFYMNVLHLDSGCPKQAGTDGAPTLNITTQPTKAA
jgi:hypothetical protein